MVNALTGERVDRRFTPNVRVGAYSLALDREGRDYDARRVVATVVHPGFRFGDSVKMESTADRGFWLNSDVALLLLDAPSGKTRPRLPDYLGEGWVRGWQRRWGVTFTCPC